jgi:hypothetical protein
MQGMDTPRGVREPEAYLPPAPDADRERYWPPSTRALAIEWARRARLQERGLAVDDAMLERVADAVVDAAYVPAAFRAENREDVLPPSLRNAVQDYLIRHPRGRRGRRCLCP